MGCSSSSPLSLPIVNSPTGISTIGAPSFPTISPGGCGIVAALGGVLPLGGCVAFVGGFAGPGVTDGGCSLLPSCKGAGDLTGGFTSPSCACCLGTAGGCAGTGNGGVCIRPESGLGATGSTASAKPERPRPANITTATVFFHNIA